MVTGEPVPPYCFVLGVNVIQLAVLHVLNVERGPTIVRLGPSPESTWRPLGPSRAQSRRSGVCRAHRVHGSAASACGVRIPHRRQSQRRSVRHGRYRDTYHPGELGPHTERGLSH